MGNGNNMGSGGRDDDFGEPASVFMRSDFGLGILNIMQQNTIPSYTYYHHQDSTQFPSGISLKPISGSENIGLMEGSGKVLFTETQWQELERQTIIYKYIMASMPVPHHLLMPLSTHSNKGGMDMRFASGSDPELWRCRRTDGKKWRCSRDVAPDQKYCEHHVHKSRPRSRKPVESQSHNTNVTTSALNITPTTYTNTLSATSSYQHPRCTEWLMKSGTLPVSSSSNQQLQQSMNSHSPRVGSKRTHIFRQDSEGNLQNDSHLHYNNSSVASDASAGARRQSFIDAWSRSGGGDDCSLTLSMQCSSGIDDDDDQRYEGGVGMLDMDRGDGLKSHNMWLNQGSWMGSPPGGPLGEALGLGIASSVKGPMDMPSCHGHSENDDSHGHELR